jgi:signal transduction histidine kinase
MALAALFVALLLAAGASLLVMTSNQLNQLQAHEEWLLVQRSLSQRLEKLAADLTTATVWDQAYRQLHPGGDKAWADAEIGTYFTNNRGHDLTLVFDAHDRVFYAYSKRGPVEPGQIAGFQHDIQPLLQSLRIAERHHAPPGPHEKPTAPELATRVHGLVRSNGVIYLVVASTVTPETWNAPRRPGPAVVVASAERMDGEFLKGLREALRVKDAVITRSTAHGDASLQLVDISGRPIGSLAWRPKEPGLEAVRSAAPKLFAGASLLFIAGLALALAMRGLARRLEANEGELARAVDDLMLARDEAQEANRAKSAFLANMSHEIRTPLNGVLGMAQVMSQHPLPADQRERLSVIHASGQLLLGVVNAVLDISKIEAGKLELECSPFDLETAVHAACDAFAVQAREKGLTFGLHVAHDARGVWLGDVVRVRQILSNLVANAVKFTSHGEVRVEVGMADQALRFEVSDTGVGVPSDQVSRLFDKFSQADSSTARRFGGTGLGLAICRELVALMSGRMSAESAIGRGSNFSFVIPLERAGAEQAPLTEAPCASKAPEQASILAVDDNATNRLIVAALLEPLGGRLRLAAGGEEAIAAFRDQRFDVILMDVQMPGMDASKPRPPSAPSKRSCISRARPSSR